MSETVRRWLAWLPAVGWATVIFVLSAQPKLPSPPGVNDKQAHGLAYGLLAVLCLAGVAGGRLQRVTGAALLGAFAIAVLYGASDEFHQSFVPGRTPDVEDLLADALGAALALLVAWVSAILLRSRNVGEVRSQKSEVRRKVSSPK